MKYKHYTEITFINNVMRYSRMVKMNDRLREKIGHLVRGDYFEVLIKEKERPGEKYPTYK